jgi:hypothetical protein
VVDLLNDEGTEWDMSKLHRVFYEFDVADILKIGVGGVGVEDRVAWNFTKNGIFFVRSAYHLQMRLRNIRGAGAVSSSSVDHHKGWLGLWGADVPGKVKIHVWRLLKNGLALGSELQRRRIKGGVVCVACGCDESAIHRFWLCPHAQQVWSAVQQMFQRLELQPPPNVLSQRDLSGWLLEWIVSAKDADVEIAFMVLYQMWLARNAARDNAQIEDPETCSKIDSPCRGMAPSSGVQGS